MIKLLSVAAAGGLALFLAGAPPAEAAPRKASGVTQEQSTEFSAHRRYRAWRAPRHRYVRRYAPRHRYVRRYYGPRYRYVRPYYAYSPYYRPAPYVAVSPLPGIHFGFGGW